MVILVVSGSSTSSMFIFRGNSRIFRWPAVVLNGFGMVIPYFSALQLLGCVSFVVVLLLLHVLGWSYFCM